MSIPSPHGSRPLTAASGILLGLVVSVAAIVGVYALRNPNHIEFGAPWPAVSELVAAAVAVSLAIGVHEQRRHARVGLFAFGAVAAVVTLLMLAAVAFVLSFNQL